MAAACLVVSAQAASERGEGPAPALARQSTGQQWCRMREPPTVSVLLPNYNHAAFLPRALQALANQTLQAAEIIIVDDASSDESVAIIESYATSLPNLRLIRNSQNLGVNRSL